MQDYDPYEENPGAAPFSEPETQMMRKLCLSFEPHIWINVHSGMEVSQFFFLLRSSTHLLLYSFPNIFCCCFFVLSFGCKPLLLAPAKNKSMRQHTLCIGFGSSFPLESSDEFFIGSSSLSTIFAPRCH